MKIILAQKTKLQMNGATTTNKAVFKMTKLQKFSVIFSITIMSTISLSSVYAGDGYIAEDDANNKVENTVENPSNVNDKPDNSNDNPNNETFQENKKIEPPPANNENHENKIDPPKENITTNNENDEDEDFYDEDKTKVPIDTGIIGDINGDSELNAVDLVILQKYLKGDAFDVNETVADINGDGTVSNFDVYALLNLIKAEKKGTGDVNNDGKVNVYDVQTLTAYLANPNNTPINSGNSDLNGDGRISTDDLKILRKVISELQQ